MPAVFVDTVLFEGTLESSLPEDPVRQYTRSGATLQCIPSATTAGRFIHVDNGFDESSGSIKLNLQFVTQDRLDTILTKYKSTSPTTIQVGDLRGNEWTCVYKPNTPAVDFQQIPHFEGLYTVTIDLNIVERTTTVSP